MVRGTLCFGGRLSIGRGDGAADALGGAATAAGATRSRSAGDGRLCAATDVQCIFEKENASTAGREDNRVALRHCSGSHWPLQMRAGGRACV